MSSGLAVIRPENRSPIVDALCHRGNGETLVIQIRHLCWPFEDRLNCEFPGCIDSKDGCAPVTGVVAYRPKIVRIAVELEIHDAREAAGNRRNTREPAAGAMVQGIGIDHPVTLDTDEEETGSVIRVISRGVGTIFAFIKEVPGREESVRNPSDPF